MRPRASTTCRILHANRITRFVRCEGGSATVEFVLWVPVLMLIVAIIADVSLLFSRQAQMLKDVQNANRSYAVGRIKSLADVESTLTTMYQPLSSGVTAKSELITSGIPGGAIRTRLSVPARDVISLGLVPSLLNLTLTVTEDEYRDF